jgi:hypothetical protein
LRNPNGRCTREPDDPEAIAVPELTRGVDIKLNQRLSLRDGADGILLVSPDISPIRPGPHQRSRQAIIFRLAALSSAEEAQDKISRSMASNLDEDNLPDRDQLRDSWMGLLHRRDLCAVDLIDLPSTPRNDQVCHQHKAWAPDGKHPEHHCFYRVHARPRHDRYDEVCPDSLNCQEKRCGAVQVD